MSEHSFDQILAAIDQIESGNDEARELPLTAEIGGRLVKFQIDTLFVKGRDSVVGWLVGFDDGEECRYLREPSSTQPDIQELIHCGCPTRILAECVVSRSIVQKAARYFCDHGTSSPDFDWVPTKDTFLLEA